MCGRHRVDGWLIIADVYSQALQYHNLIFFAGMLLHFVTDGTSTNTAVSLKLIVVIISHGFGLLLYCTKNTSITELLVNGTEVHILVQTLLKTSQLGW